MSQGGESWVAQRLRPSGAGAPSFATSEGWGTGPHMPPAFPSSLLRIVPHPAGVPAGWGTRWQGVPSCTDCRMLLGSFADYVDWRSKNEVGSTRFSPYGSLESIDAYLSIATPHPLELKLLHRTRQGPIPMPITAFAGTPHKRSSRRAGDSRHLGFRRQGVIKSATGRHDKQGGVAMS